MMRSAVAALALLAFSGFAAPVEAADQSLPADRAALEQVIHDYLLAHPEVIIEALQAAERKMKDDQAEASKAALRAHGDELLHDPASPVGGNPAGDVTIVEFFDYHCPYCKQVEPALEALLREDPKLRIVYKEFPILGPQSLVASQVALAALKQGAEKYSRFHAALMGTKGDLSDAVIMKVAGDAGLDTARLRVDMKAPEVEAAIKRNYRLADLLDIKGTPAFIIGDILTPGAVDINALRKMIADTRKGD